jgi:hypothetical protein
MRGLWQLRESLRQMMDASFERELLAACAPRHAASREAHSALDVFEGLFTASLISSIFWLALGAFFSR